MNTVNKELVKKWVEALRSGKYKQGRKALRNKNDEFCCLGVLCDISKKDLGIDWEPEESGIYVMEKNGGLLPDRVWEYIGRKATTDYKVQISITNPKLPDFIAKNYPSGYLYLVTLNDTYGLSFEQIADIIEEEFLR